MKLSLTDVSCGAATTDNILTTPQKDHPPQIEAVTPDTKLVTVTIGGNDVDYTVTNLGCAGDAKAGQSCLGTSVQPTDLEAKMAALPAKLDATFAAIKAKAPKATIVVLPYLRVFPAPPVPCPPSVPMDTPTLYYLSGSSDKLHTAIKDAATRARCASSTRTSQGSLTWRGARAALGRGRRAGLTRGVVPPQRRGHEGPGEDDRRAAEGQDEGLTPKLPDFLREWT